MINYLNTFPFRSIIWSVSIILLFHELSEWNIKGWHKKHFTNIPDESNLSLRLWMLFFSFIGFLWTGISCSIPNQTISCIWLLVLIYVTLLNGIQHFILLISYKEISNPGSFFALWFGIPVDIYVMYRMVIEDMIPLWGMMLFSLIIVLITVKTIKNMRIGELPKIINLCSSIGLKLEHLMTN